MAGRCGPCHGILAGALPRLHERRAAGFVGAWLCVIGARLRLPVRRDRVARPAVDRDTAGPRRGLDPVLRERAGGLGCEQAPTAGNQGRGEAPLLSIFKRGLLLNTLTACFWIASTFCVYYSIWALFSAYLQKELNWTPLMVATPVFWANIVVFAGNSLWGFVSDIWGRRPGMIVPATIAIFLTPFYLWTSDPIYIVSAFIVQGMFGGSIYGPMRCYLCERFPTEVRATASGFIFHQGAIWGGLVAPVLTYLAVQMNFGFAMPIMISTILFLVLVVISVLLGPETKGKTLTADLEVIKGVAQPAT